MRGAVGGAGLGDLVEAEGGGGHVFIHAIQTGVQSGSVRVPELQAAASRAVPVLPAPVQRLRVTGQGGWDEGEKMSRLCSFSGHVKTRKFC